MVTVYIEHFSNIFMKTIKSKKCKNLNDALRFVKKYEIKHPNDSKYRATFYSYNISDIKDLAKKFGEGKIDNIIELTEIYIETTLDLMPTILYYETGCTCMTHDYHKDCIELKQDDIIFSFKDNTYYWIFKDPNEYDLTCCAISACKQEPYSRTSRMDIRKVSSDEIRKYNLNRIKEIYIETKTREEFEDALTELVDNNPRLDYIREGKKRPKRNNLSIRIKLW